MCSRSGLQNLFVEIFKPVDDPIPGVVLLNRFASLVSQSLREATIMEELQDRSGKFPRRGILCPDPVCSVVDDTLKACNR